MRRLTTVLLAILCASPAFAEDAYYLVGLHEATQAKPHVAPPATIVNIDIHSGSRLLATRPITLRDTKIRETLYDDPMLLPGASDTAYLATRHPKHGTRIVTLSWSRREDIGPSRCIPDIWTDRPRELVPGKVGFFSNKTLIAVDLAHARVTDTPFANEPLDIDASRNRVYVCDRRLAYHPLLVSQPPPGVKLPATPAFALPDNLRPVRGAVRADGNVFAYLTVRPTLRKDKKRFVLSVADHRSRLLVRRSLRGKPWDIRWLDAKRVIVTAVDGDRTWVHVLTVKSDVLTSRRLPPTFLAVPELVPARWLRAVVRSS